MRFSRRLARLGLRGFSLVEVVLALGIVSFSLIGILSMFPLALDTAKDSKNETRIVLIAQSIYSDMQSSPATNAAVVYNEIGDPANKQFVAYPLTNFTTTYVAYNAEGLAIKRLNSVAEFNQYPGADAAFLASVAVTTNNILPEGLAKVDVSVQAPPQASSSGGSVRKKYYFSALIPFQ